MDGVKPLSKPMLEYCLLNPWEQVSVKCWLEFKIIFHDNALENVVCEMASILSRPQCVNMCCRLEAMLPKWVAAAHLLVTMVTSSVRSAASTGHSTTELSCGKNPCCACDGKNLIRSFCTTGKQWVTSLPPLKRIQRPLINTHDINGSHNDITNKQSWVNIGIIQKMLLMTMINMPRSGGVCMHHWTQSSRVRAMAWHLTSGKPLYELTLTYYQTVRIMIQWNLNKKVF